MSPGPLGDPGFLISGDRVGMETKKFVVLLVAIALSVGSLGAWLIRDQRPFVPCPECGGTGAASCGVSGCLHGQVPCPGQCLKAEGKWEAMEVEGHSPDERWQVFNNPGGGWVAWTKAHIGQSIELVDGKWTNMGTCKICGGTTRVECPHCHGRIPCPKCKGKKVVRQGD